MTMYILEHPAVYCAANTVNCTSYWENQAFDSTWALGFVFFIKILSSYWYTQIQHSALHKANCHNVQKMEKSSLAAKNYMAALEIYVHASLGNIVWLILRQGMEFKPLFLKSYMCVNEFVKFNR